MRRISYLLTVLILAFASGVLALAGCGGTGGGGGEAGNALGPNSSGSVTLRVSLGGDGPPRIEVREEALLLTATPGVRGVLVEFYRLPQEGSDPDLARRFEIFESSTVVVDGIPAPASYLVFGTVTDSEGRTTGSFQVDRVDILPGRVTTASASVVPNPSATPTFSPSPSPSPTGGVAGNVFDISGTATPATNPNVDMRADGTFAVCWDKAIGLGPDEPVVARAFAGSVSPTPLYGPVLARIPAAGDIVGQSDVAIDDNGHFGVSWYEERAASKSISADFFDVVGGFSLTGPQALVTTSTNFLGDPVMAMASVGLAGVDWTEVVVPGFTNQARNNRLPIPSGSPLAGVTQVDPVNTNGKIFPALAADPLTGDFVHVYQDLATNELRGLVTNNGQTQSARFSIVTDPSFSSRPRVAVRDGRIVVAYAADLAGHPNIFALRFSYDPGNVGAGVSALDASPILVNQTSATGSHLDPDVAVDSSGNFVVCWEDYTARDPNADIFARAFTAAGVGGTNFMVNTSVAGDNNRPRMAMNPAGLIVIVWRDVAAQSIVGREFAPGFGR